VILPTNIRDVLQVFFLFEKYGTHAWYKRNKNRNSGRKRKNKTRAKHVKIFTA
jgi:hypothetical protein